VEVAERLKPIASVVERLNATFRAWLLGLTRRSLTSARQVVQLEASLFCMGAVYNFCRVHATPRARPQWRPI
jgi:hypothetical protein